MVNGGKYTSLMDPFWKMNHLMQPLIFIVPQWWEVEETVGFFLCEKQKTFRGGGFNRFFCFHPLGNDPV